MKKGGRESAEGNPQGLPSWLLIIVGLVGFAGCSYSPPPGSFNVVVSSFTTRPSPVHVNDKVVFLYDLKNVGTNVAPAGKYLHDLFVDGRLTSFDHATSDMQPGNKVSYGMAPGHFHWQATNIGQHVYELVIVEPGKTNR